MKPGVKSTELIVTVLSEVGYVLAAVTGNLAPHWAAIAAAASQAAYALSRGIAKHGQKTIVAPATPPVPTVPTTP